MIHLENDYLCGAHPEVMQRLCETNLVPAAGYGLDPFCESAAGKIRRFIGMPDADIRFISGGTQTNAIVIASMLRQYEGVIAAATGHISVHEAGAIEYGGHKVLTLPSHLGKIDAGELDSLIAAFHADGNCDHMVFPGMVYISFPTEYGTLYTRRELEEISAVCRRHSLPLYIDGARLGYGLASPECDIDIHTLASLCDVFYIGGTKVGALCGEAVVFPRGNAPAHFMTIVKQMGGLMAKGRLMGVQFDALFTDDLYMRISRHAIKMAEELRKVLTECGMQIYMESPTNQQFIVLENDRLQRLSQQVGMSFWETLDDTHTVVRLATSWSTTPAEIHALKEILHTALRK